MSHAKMEGIRDVLEEYHPRIRGIVERAWSEWRSIAEFRSENGIGPVLYPRTVSNDVFDGIARHAINEFGSDPFVALKVEAQTIKLHFGGNVLARFKRGNKNKLGQNIATQAALAFADADGTFPGFPPETAKVEFIWMANDIQTRLEHVFVVARDRDRLLWDYEIEAKAEDSGSVVPFPTGQDAPEPADDEGLVTPKTPDTQIDEKE